MAKQGNRTFQRLLHRNLEVEIFRMKNADSPFGTGRSAGSLILDEEKDLLYLLLINGAPFHTISKLQETHGVILIGGDNYSDEFMKKVDYDNPADPSSAVDYTRGLGYVEAGTPFAVTATGVVLMSAQEVIEHVKAGPDNVPDPPGLQPEDGPHGINLKADLHGDPTIHFRVAVAQTDDEAVRLRRYWDIQYELISPMQDVAGSTNYFWKGFWPVQVGIYPMTAMRTEQTGWYWIVTQDGTDDNVRQWKAGDYMVYNGAGNGSTASSWDRVNINDQTSSSDNSGLELVNTGWMYIDEDRTDKLVIGDKATDQSHTESPIPGVPRHGASGDRSHALNTNTLASGDNSLAVGKDTAATSDSSLAGGKGTNVDNPVTASGIASFNHSQGGSDVSGISSAKLGGGGGDVTGDRSVSLGGGNLINSEDDTTMVAKLNVGDGAKYPPVDKDYDNLVSGKIQNDVLVRGQDGKVHKVEDRRNWSQVVTTSLLSGGIAERLTQGGNPANNSTFVRIPAGSGQIINHWETTTDPKGHEIPKRTYVTWPQTDIDIESYMGQPNGYVYVYIDNAGGGHAQNIELSNSQRRQNIELAVVYYENPTGLLADKNITTITTIPVLPHSTGATVYDLIEYLPDRTKMKGIQVRAVTDPLPVLSVWQTAGSTFITGANWINQTTDPNVINIPQAGAGDTAVPFTVVLSDGTTAIDPDSSLPLTNQTVMPKLWEQGTTDIAVGTVTKLNAGATNPQESTAHYFFRAFGGSYYLQLGQHIYPTGRDARNNLSADQNDTFFFPNANQSWNLAQIYVSFEAVDFEDVDKAGIANSSGDFSQGADAITSFINLDDVPLTYIGSAKHTVRVNEGETGLIFEKPNRIYEFVTQNNHGFTEGNQVYYDNGTSVWRGAVADLNALTANSLKTAYVHLTGTNNTDTFEAVYEGTIDVPAHGWTINNMYYVTDVFANAGQVIPDAPADTRSFRQRAFLPVDADRVTVINWPLEVDSDSAPRLILKGRTCNAAVTEHAQVYYDNSTNQYELAQADAEGTLRDGMAINVNGTVCDVIVTGEYVYPAAHGLTPNTTYYLDDATAGAMISTIPTSRYAYQQACMHVMDATTVMVLNQAVKGPRYIRAGTTAATSTFTGLTDTPGNYTGHANKSVFVNAAANSLEFRTFTGGWDGTVDLTMVDGVQLESDHTTPETILQPNRTAPTDTIIPDALSIELGEAGTEVNINGLVSTNLDMRNSTPITAWDGADTLQKNLISRTDNAANAGTPTNYASEVLVGDEDVATAIRVTTGFDPVVRKGAAGTTTDYRIITAEDSHVKPKRYELLSATGGETGITLAEAPHGDFWFSINGSVQYSDDYTISTNTILFNAPLTQNDRVVVQNYIA